LSPEAATLYGIRAIGFIVCRAWNARSTGIE
jgi:hypothetical protein